MAKKRRRPRKRLPTLRVEPRFSYEQTLPKAKKDPLIARRRKFKPWEPGILASTLAPRPGPRPLVRERIPIRYVGFQLEQRVRTCDQKRERRRRAYFGYLKSPHAGKGPRKRLSPRGDRFTVKC